MLLNPVRVLVAGSRTFNNYKYLEAKLDRILINLPKPDIVSGCARGADTLGEIYADNHSLDIHRFPADWNRYGKRAGYIRNRDLVSFCTHAVVFWDGVSKGTANTIELLVEACKPTKIIKVDNIK